jgi:hypothetical protein
VRNDLQQINTETDRDNSIQRTGGFRAEVKEMFGFDLPAADTEKYALGNKVE